MPEPAIDVERLRDLMREHMQVEVPSADADLLDSGLLDSLQLVDLLLLIEQHFGRRIAIEAIDLENLRSLRRIAQLLGTPAATASSTHPARRAETDPKPRRDGPDATRRGASADG